MPMTVEAVRGQKLYLAVVDALRREIEARMNLVRSPFRTAVAFIAEEIIDPRDTRPLLCEFAELAAPLRASGPATHGYRP